MSHQTAPVLWRPPPALVDSSTMSRFARWVETDLGLQFDTYEALWQWSIDDLDAFWNAVWRFFEVQADGVPDPVLASREMPGAQWFPGVQLSYPEHVLRGKPDDDIAILHASELRDVGERTWAQLREQVTRIRAAVLYEGNPGNDDMGVLWGLAERTRTTCFGTSAAFIHACMKSGIEPAAGRDLSRLTSVGSTGSPLSPEGFHWVYDQLGSDTWLFSTSGGSDVCSVFVGGTPMRPVRLGELQARALGADVRAFDDDGNELVDEVGELVVVQPMPSMPVGFWGDADGTRYAETYFDTYPGVWRHGDWIRITPDGGAVIYGRSDSTINRGGIRMGTAEIYRSALGVDAVRDALVVDVPDRDGTGDSWMPMFVVLADGEALTDELVKTVRGRIRRDCSPRHVPDEVTVVEEIPRTLSEKILEVPVKKLLMGSDPDTVVSRDSLANPDAFEWFVAFAAERAAAVSSESPRVRRGMTKEEMQHDDH